MNIKTYRYEGLQKDVTEKIAKKILDVGVIRGSFCSYSILLVLVKKKMALGIYI